jgi:HK97 family phage portal protein
MSLLARLLQPSAVHPLMDDRLWSSYAVGSEAYSGVYVTPETSLMSSAVWACVQLISESIATMPAIMYRRLANGGKERAPDHPLYSMLHDDPNEWQTAFTFKKVMMVHALLYGNGYARIVAGPRGPVDALEPIHPDDIELEALRGGGYRYKVRNADGVKVPVNAEDIFHLPGLSLDGVQGLSLVKYARESIALALAADRYSAKLYGQGAHVGGLLRHPNKLSPEAAQRIKMGLEPTA